LRVVVHGVIWAERWIWEEFWRIKIKRFLHWIVSFTSSMSWVAFQWRRVLIVVEILRNFTILRHGWHRRLLGRRKLSGGCGSNKL
jgi:hypothetical protein